MKRIYSAKNFNLVAAFFSFVIITPLIMLMFNFSSEYEEKKPKIGIIIPGDINISGWNKSHYDGIKAACDEFGLELLVRDKVQENSGQCPAAIKDLAKNGVGMICFASYAYAIEARDLVSDYPNIAFATISAENHAKNMTAYFIRIYQGRYLAGALAGMKTKTNIVGFVAAKPNTEVKRGINAFALGVQRTNPNAKVLVMWTNSWQDDKIETEHAQQLIEAGADILTYHQNEDVTARVAEKYGVEFIAFNEILSGYSEKYLTSVICRWDLYYSEMIQRYLKGELNSVKNYWMGIDQKAIMLSDYSSNVPENMRLKLNLLKQEIINGNMIFSGEIYDNAGQIRCKKGEAISDDKLLEDVNWLVKGVEVLE
ncbi:MAG: BMP family ABC transporter substrate-binding protein [Quinella sp. 3Q1]|nr:BMP family ABC transporter substrate-binding protein [Quinella sp. 3Q1]